MVDTITANVVPSASLSAVGFAFPDLQAAWNALDGSCGAFVRDQIQKQAGIYSFATAWDGGFKQISNSLRPIATPDDLKGLKIRVPPGPIAVSLYKTLGASPTAIDVTEQYTAAQTHLLDGADTSASLLLSSKLYEVQKYLSITNHSLIAWHLLAAPGPWQALPKNLRDLTEQSFNAAAKVNRQQEVRDFDGIVATLKSHGLQVNEPNTAPFRAALPGTLAATIPTGRTNSARRPGPHSKRLPAGSLSSRGPRSAPIAPSDIRPDRETTAPCEANREPRGRSRRPDPRA